MRMSNAIVFNCICSCFMSVCILVYTNKLTATVNGIFFKSDFGSGVCAKRKTQCSLCTFLNRNGPEHVAQNSCVEVFTCKMLLIDKPPLLFDFIPYSYFAGKLRTTILACVAQRLTKDTKGCRRI